MFPPVPADSFTETSHTSHHVPIKAELFSFSQALTLSWWKVVWLEQRAAGDLVIKQQQETEEASVCRVLTTDGFNSVVFVAVQNDRRHTQTHTRGKAWHYGNTGRSNPESSVLMPGCRAADTNIIIHIIAGVCPCVRTCSIYTGRLTLTRCAQVLRWRPALTFL